MPTSSGRYGNYSIKQFGENYGSDMVKELAGYKIKELEDPKKASQLIKTLKEGNRPVVTVTGVDMGRSRNCALRRYRVMGTIISLS